MDREARSVWLRDTKGKKMPSMVARTQDDERVKAEASSQIGRNVEIEKVHISLVRPYDTVFHGEKARTVCIKDLKNDSFMGRTLFGDSYVLGRLPVQRIVMNAAND